MKNNIDFKEGIAFFKNFYPSEVQAKKRYQKLLEEFQDQFGSPFDGAFFSSPGRVEIIGNHTDHNSGQVIAASIDLDSIALASKTSSNLVRIKSLSYDSYFEIDLQKLQPDSFKGSKELVKGILQGIKNNQRQVKGLDICVDSLVLPGSGMSSSASFAMLICEIINSFYNDNKMTKFEMAKCAKFAENEYWHKKSGLLDELACAYGGMIALDFQKEIPTIKKLKTCFLTNEFVLLLVQSGSNHEDLSSLYSSIPKDMYEIANYFKKPTLREVNKQDFYQNINELRKHFTDKAILRAVHYFEENARVNKVIKALETEDYLEVINNINESGISSYKYLQNCWIPNNSKQSLAMTLMLTRRYLKTITLGACRVHGGGFAGTILVVLPKAEKTAYIEYMNKYQNYKIIDLNIRDVGCINVSKYIEVNYEDKDFSS